MLQRQLLLHHARTGNQILQSLIVQHQVLPNPTIPPTTSSSKESTDSPSITPTQFFNNTSAISTTMLIISRNSTNETIIRNTATSQNVAADLTNNLNQNFETILIALLVVFTLGLISGYVHSRFISINHYFYFWIIIFCYVECIRYDI